MAAKAGHPVRRSFAVVPLRDRWDYWITRVRG